MTEIRELQDLLSILTERCPEDSYVFRGQPADKPLVPKLGRLTCHQGRRTAERRLLGEFRRRAVPYLDMSPQTELDWLALAQHHGLPTRLLDWTSNPLAALWFAVENAKQRVAGALWILEDKNHLHDSDGAPVGLLNITAPILCRPREISRRIGVQSGYFTAHPMNDQEELVPLEDCHHSLGSMFSLTIPREQFDSLRWDLDRCGVNHASLFPDMDGLCRHLQWSVILEDDEQ